jgi:hypothetical protein
LKNFFAFFSLFLFFTFVILNIGFATIGIFGIPIFALISALVTILLILFYPNSFSNFPKPIISAYFLLVLYSGTICILSALKGYPILRIVQDFEMIFDMIFIAMGFFVANYLGKENIKKTLTTLFILCFLSGLIIFGIGEETIQSFSPSVGIYRPVSLFGNVVGYFYLLTVGGFYFLYVNPMRNFNLVLFPLLCTVSLFPQKRFSIIIILSFIFHYLIFTRSSKKFQLILGLFLLFLIIISLGSLNIEGTRGSFNIEFFSTLYSSIFLNPETQLSGGVFWRLNVVLDSVSKMENIYDYIFGIGFGQPLSNLANLTTGLTTRQTHIFLLDVWMRIGFIGLIMTINVLYLILKNIYSSYEESKISSWFFITALLLILCAQSNPLLQQVHMSLPIYVLIGMGISLKKD